MRKALTLHYIECQRWQLLKGGIGCPTKASLAQCVSFLALSGSGEGDDTILQGYIGKDRQGSFGGFVS